MIKPKRSGLKDCWNAYLCEGAVFTNEDIPNCPTTAKELPKDMILWDEAKSIYKKENAKGNTSFYVDAYVCFYMDDYKFDGPNGVWFNCKHALEILKHFAGVVTVDFSTYKDFPEPIKIYNTFRMRALGYWFGTNGLNVINNVRWGTKESWKYCWSGISKNSIVAIGTVGGSPRRKKDRKRFNDGFEEMIRVLNPKTIIVYGSANYDVFKSAEADGIKVVVFKSRTSIAFNEGKNNE